MTMNFFKTTLFTKSIWHLICLILLGSGLISIYYRQIMNFDTLFNSDSVYLSVLFDDLAYYQGKLSHWFLTPAPYFFPDMPIFFFSSLLTPSIYHRFFIAAFLQLASTYFLAHQLRQVFSTRLCTSVGLSIIFILACIVWIPQDQSPYIFGFLTTYHFGTLMLGLGFLTLFFKSLLQPKSKPIFISLSIIAGVGVASDLIFVIQILLPLVATIFIVRRYAPTLPNMKQQRNYVLAGMIIGLLIKSLMTKDHAHRYLLKRHKELFQHFFYLLDILQSWIQAHPLVSATVFLFYICIAWHWYQLYRNRQDNQNHRFLLTTFVLLSPPITIIIVFINGLISLPDWFNLRYFQNLFWFPIFFCWLLLDSLPTIKKPIALIILVSFLIGTIFLIYPKTPLKSQYQPPLVSCLLNGLQKYRQTTGDSVTVGISHYWHAKLTLAFARDQLMLVQVNGDTLKSLRWIMNTDWYQPRYDFALGYIDSDGKSQLLNALRKLTLQPKAQFTCPTGADRIGRQVQVWIYGHQKLAL